MLMKVTGNQYPNKVRLLSEDDLTKSRKLYQEWKTKYMSHLGKLLVDNKYSRKEDTVRYMMAYLPLYISLRFTMYHAWYGSSPITLADTVFNHVIKHGTTTSRGQHIYL